MMIRTEEQLKLKEFVRSDLASEMMEDHAKGLDGVDLHMRRAGEFLITELSVRTPAGAAKLDKPCGRYLTLECGRIDRLDVEKARALAHLLAGELRGMGQRLTGKRVDASFCVFVAGLGNAELTADALGPETVRRLSVTRHLREHEEQIYRKIGCASIASLAPGVLGQTGIETGEILRGIVNAIHPDLILVVDALSARSCDHLSTTVQLSDVGIAPGSGVGNHRTAINRESMGVPVIAMGVPTVVNSATLVYDALQEAGITSENQNLQRVLERGKSFFVSPKECDVICDKVADLFSMAIGMAFASMLVME